VGSGRCFLLLRHPGLDPGSTTTARLWIPDQVRDDDEKIGQHPVACCHRILISGQRRKWVEAAARDNSVADLVQLRGCIGVNQASDLVHEAIEKQDDGHSN
jgi:hypothetical protein